MILSGVTLRITIAFLAVTGNKFTVKEKLFIAISWLPKATVQVRIASWICYNEAICRQL